MGLLIRIYDIKSENDFDLSVGFSPYGPFTSLPNPNRVDGSWPSSNLRNYYTEPIYIGDNDPMVLNGKPSITDIVEYDLEFDTQYWLKIEDKINVIDLCGGNNTPRFIVENIYIHDSKAFECYDRVAFDVVYDPDTCPTPTPYPSSTPYPTSIVDCDINANFVEFFGTDCDIDANFDEFFDVLDCQFEATFRENT